MGTALLSIEESVAKKLRVLVVEDDYDAAASSVALLRLWGHQTWLAHDGLAALALAEQEAPDVILLDIGLPRMDGYQIAKALRAKRPCKRPVLIAVTGYGAPQDRRQSYEAGIDLHLVKPVDPQELQHIFERLSRIAK
jgi:CheY-like chemotaxis protein